MIFATLVRRIAGLVVLLAIMGAGCGPATPPPAETLPPEVELEKVEAVYRNGVLEVHLPRKPEAVGRRVEVKT